MTPESTSDKKPSTRRFQFSLSLLLASVFFCYGQQMVNILWNEHNYSHPNLTPSVVFVTLSSLTTCYLILFFSRHRSRSHTVLTFIIAFLALLPLNLIAGIILRPTRYNCGFETASAVACKAYATAQDIYFRRNYSHNELPEYAISLEDLYESKPGAGDLALIDRSFRDAEVSQPTVTPKYGYLFKVLTAQGTHARGGARGYLSQGHMLSGYALIAFPAGYTTHINSFIINQDGEIYEADLGPDTAKTAQAMTIFDPDPKIWTVAE